MVNHSSTIEGTSWSRYRCGYYDADHDFFDDDAFQLELEDEFCHNFVCCDVHLEDLHALLEHCEEYHYVPSEVLPPVLPALYTEFDQLPPRSRALADDLVNRPSDYSVQLILDSFGPEPPEFIDPACMMENTSSLNAPIVRQTLNQTIQARSTAVTPQQILSVPCSPLMMQSNHNINGSAISMPLPAMPLAQTSLTSPLIPLSPIMTTNARTLSIPKTEIETDLMPLDTNLGDKTPFAYSMFPDVFSGMPYFEDISNESYSTRSFSTCFSGFERQQVYVDEDFETVSEEDDDIMRDHAIVISDSEDDEYDGSCDMDGEGEAVAMMLDTSDEEDDEITNAHEIVLEDNQTSRPDVRTEVDITVMSQDVTANVDNRPRASLLETRDNSHMMQVLSGVAQMI